MELSPLANIVLSGTLILGMFGLGADVRPSDFARVLREPAALTIATAAQLVLVPLFGFALVRLFPLPSELAVGVVIIAACPGGAVSNLIAYLARADVALSVSLTAISSVAAVLTVPFIVNHAVTTLSRGGVVEFPIAFVAMQLVLLTLLPLAAGMTVRHIAPRLATSIERRIRRLAMVLLAVIIVLVLGENLSELPHYLGLLGLPLVLFNIVLVGLGWALSRALSLNQQKSTTLMIEIGIRNGALGITIPAVFIGNADMAIAPAIYGILMLVTGGILVALSPMRRVPEEG